MPPTVAEQVGSAVDELNIDQKIEEIVDKKIAEIEIPVPENGTDGKDGVDGKDGADGKDGTDGKDADEEAIVEKIKPLIPTKEDILASIKVPKVDKNEIIKKVIEQIPHNQASLKVIQERIEADPTAIAEKLMAMPEFKLKVKNIEGLDATLKLLDRRYIHGGGDTVSAGTNISLVRLSNGTVQINSTGGLTILPATGLINDTNQNFIFTQKPSIIVMNGISYNDGATTGGVTAWTWNSGTNTATMFSPVGVGNNIFGIA